MISVYISIKHFTVLDRCRMRWLHCSWSFLRHWDLCAVHGDRRCAKLCRCSESSSSVRANVKLWQFGCQNTWWSKIVETFSEKFLVWDIQMCIITLFWCYWWVFIFFNVHYFDTQTMLIVSHSPTWVSFKWPKIGCMKDRRLAAFFMEVSDSTNESWPQMIPKQQNPTPCYHVWLWKS